MPRDGSFYHVENYVEADPLIATLARLTELDLVNFSNGLIRPDRKSYELKEYFYIVQDLFTDDSKGDGNPRIPHDVVHAIQRYTDTRIHT